MYLVASKEIPITAADVRAELGLRSADLDAVIEGGISAVTIQPEARWSVCLRPQIWAVQRVLGQPVTDFFRATRGKRNLSQIGPAYWRDNNPSDRDGPYHDCTYLADARHVTALTGAVAAWCLRQDDICDLLAAERRSLAA